MTLTITPLNTRDGGQQVDTRAMPRPHRIPPAIPTAPTAQRYSLVWFGWGINKGSTNRETYMTDISATIAALLHIQMPNGCIGKVIQEVVK